MRLRIESLALEIYRMFGDTAKLTHCENCSSNQLLRITYGIHQSLRWGESADDAQHRGCVISLDSPNYACRECRHEFKWNDQEPEVDASDFYADRKERTYDLQTRTEFYRAMQIYLGLRHPATAFELNFVANEMVYGEVTFLLQESVSAFHELSLYEQNPVGDLVWAAIIEGLDAYRVGNLSFVPQQKYVTRWDVGNFQVPELSNFGSLMSIDEDEQEYFGDILGLDYIDEDCFFLDRGAAAQMLAQLLAEHKNIELPAQIDSVQRSPFYQLAAIWNEEMLNCEPGPFFESQLFAKYWEATGSDVPAEKAAATFNTYFLYRGRSVGGPYIVSVADIPDFLWRLTRMCELLGWDGLDAFGRRAKLNLDQNPIIDEAGEWFEALINDDQDAAERARQAHEAWITDQEESDRARRDYWSEVPGSNMFDDPDYDSTESDFTQPARVSNKE